MAPPSKPLTQNTMDTPSLPITTTNRAEARRFLTAKGLPFKAIAAATLSELSDLIANPETLARRISETTTTAATATTAAAETTTNHQTMSTPTAPNIDVNAIAAAIAAAIQPAPAPAPALPADLADRLAATETLADNLSTNLSDLRDKLFSTRVLNRHSVERLAALTENLIDNQDNQHRLLDNHNDRITKLRDDLNDLKAGTGSTLEPRLAALETALAAAPAAVRTRAATHAAASTNPILAKILPYYPAGSDNAATVCALLSPPSFGKSHTARELGRTYDLFLEHGCSDDVDEISTLLGTVAPDGKGGFLTVDGVLTQAVRAASEGKNVLLFLDEIFRLSARAQEWMLTFLAPSKHGFSLRTRKALPDGTFETLTAPTDRLHILTAANLTHTEPTEAFWSRLHKIRIPFDVAALAAIAAQVLTSYSIKGPGKLPQAFAQLMDTTRKAAKEGAMRYPADIRLLVRACAHATSPDETAVAEHITRSLADHCSLWDGDLGETLAQSAAAAKSAAEAFAKACR